MSEKEKKTAVPPEKQAHLRQVIFVRGNHKKGYDNKIIMVDCVGGEPRHQVVEDPKITFYVDKPETYDGKYRLYRSIEDVDIVRDVPYRELKEELAYHTHNERALKIAKSNGGRAVSELIQRMSGEPNIHGSDVNITDHYISRWCRKNKDIMTTTPQLHKCYLDIETDDYHQPRMSRPGEGAEGNIDLISLYSDKYNTCHTYALKTKDNPQIAKYIDQIEEHKRRIEERYRITWKPHFYDSEADMICDMFDTINAKHMRPDFCGMWNAAYDYQMLRERLEYHGINPASVICPSGFPYAHEYYYVDENQQTYNLKTRGDYMMVAGYTQYICQQITFAQVRANEPNRDSYKLKDVLEDILGEDQTKDEVPVAIRKFSRYDYGRYVEYNVTDTVRLSQLEDKTQDISLMYTVAMITQTRLHKALRKTTSLRNLAQRFLFENGLVLSNNHNTTGWGNDSAAKEKFDGAFVLDPKTLAHIGEMIMGQASNRVFRGVGDADMKAMYPLIYMYGMLDPSNQIGRILFQNCTNNKLTDEMIFDFVRRDHIKFGNKWFSLPNKEQLLRHVLLAQ